MTNEIKNQQFKELERDLLKAGKLPAEQIEEIIAEPKLFNLVRAEIAHEKARRANKKSFSPFFFFGKWQTVGVAFAAFFILLIGLLAFAPRKSVPTDEKARQELPPIKKEQPKVERVIEPEKALIEDDAPVKSAPRIRRQFIAAQTLSKKAEKIAGNAKREPRARIKPESDGEFLPLTYAGNLPDDEQRIVRVELPPSRLLSLGIPVHMENESEKIKTDLLVGSDGVARAIRLVK